MYFAKQRVSKLWKLVHFATFLSIISCQSQDSRYPGTPGEFEETESIYLSWNLKDSHSRLEPVYFELVKNLIGEAKINILVDNEKKIPILKQSLKNRNIPTRKINFITNPDIKSIWIRDSGPLFFFDEENSLKSVNFVPYDFNDYFVSKELSKRETSQQINSSIFSFGGSREFNGRQTMILNTQVEAEFNAHSSKAEVEREYREKFHVKNIIWLKKGTILDEPFEKGPIYDNIYPLGAGGHIDEFCRFVNDSTVLLTWYDSLDIKGNKIYELDAARMKDNYDILQKSKLADGRPLRIIKIPPPPFLLDSIYIYNDGTYFTKKTNKKYRKVLPCVVPTSYLNFIVVNDVVITSTYENLELDERMTKNEQEVKRIFEEVFPKKRIVMIPTYFLNLEGGGLHCITIHKPKKRRLIKPKTSK